MLSQNDKKKQYLDHILQNLPHKPGIYKMKDEQGTIIYVGKAKDLKNRVSSYFKNDPNREPRTLKMIEHIADIDYTEVESDLEAIILETNLIKEIRPKYNVLMKDDKNYVYLKITVGEEYPRIYLVRQVAKDKAKYFGPKTAAHKLIKTLKLLKSIFPFKNCQLAMDYGVYAENKYKNMSPAQMEYHKRHCLGPCIMSVPPDEYRKTVDQVIAFFEGKHDDIIKKVKEEMTKAANEKRFEVAAAIRDKLSSLEGINESQRVSDPTLNNLDIINYFSVDDKVYFNLFQVREGKLIGQENFTLKSTAETKTGNSSFDPDALASFLEQYYEKTTDIPKEILIPHEIEEPEVIENWLNQMTSHKVKIQIPERGKKNHLLDLSLENAKSFAKQSMIKWQGTAKETRDVALRELQDLLNLKESLNRIECYDVSHFQGTETVGSMVVFEKGFPKKDDYRHFKLHQETSGAPDDYASIAEMLNRRSKYLKPAIASKEISLKKPTKKYISIILNKIKTKKLPAKTYLVVEKCGTAVGFVEVLISTDKKALLNKEYLNTEIDRNLLIKKIIEKAKVARLYLRVAINDISAYEEIGCQKIQKIPDFIKPEKGTTVLVYDKTKYADDKSFKKPPDLIIIDGGKGQLNAALKTLKDFQLQIPLISIAKKEEEIMIPGRPQSIRLSHTDPMIHLIQHLRDESHRFAITYHHKLRLKVSSSSILDTIYGLGPELKSKLLNAFSSPSGIKEAEVEEIAKIVGKNLAEKIKKTLN